MSEALSPLEYRSDAKLLPPNVRDFRAEGPRLCGLSLGWCGGLDLKAIMRAADGLGWPPFDPRMMVSLLLHGYAERAVFVAAHYWKHLQQAEFRHFVMIVALDPPDFRNDQRLPQAPFEGARRVVPPGSEVVRDGRGWSNSATSHWMARGRSKARCVETCAMRYERTWKKRRGGRSKAEVASRIGGRRGGGCPRGRDFGKDKRGDEMPDWASDKAKRLAKIQEAMAALGMAAKLAEAE